MNAMTRGRIAMDIRAIHGNQAIFVALAWNQAACGPTHRNQRNRSFDPHAWQQAVVSAQCRAVESIAVIFKEYTMKAMTQKPELKKNQVFAVETVELNAREVHAVSGGRKSSIQQSLSAMLKSIRGWKV